MDVVEGLKRAVVDEDTESVSVTDTDTEYIVVIV